MKRALLFLALLLTASACNRERNQSIKLMNDALREFQSGNTAAAITVFNQAASVDPTNDRVFFYRALLKYQ